MQVDPEQIVETSGDVLKNAFDSIQFEGEGADNLHSFVKSCFKLLEESAHPKAPRFPYTMTFQSSGWGKSRQAVHLCNLKKEDPSFRYMFCCVRKEARESMGYPPACLNLIENLKSICQIGDEDKAVKRMQLFFGSSMHCASNLETLELQNSFDSTFWDAVWKNSQDLSPRELLSGIARLHFVIFFDEANSLIDMTMASDQKDCNLYGTEV
jgi:hypothetical protein